MKLSQMLEKVNTSSVYADTEITSLVYDSRKAQSGSAFVCMRGAAVDGHSFAPSAYLKGCRCFICEEKLDLPDDAVQIITENTRSALAKMSAAFFGYPAEKLTLIGITGTKGKTTIGFFLYEILKKHSNGNAALCGTEGIFIKDKHIPTANTTPESYELHSAFAEMVEAGVKYAIMEVSSQAYKTCRVDGLKFDIGVFTNLSPDHIGGSEHADFEEYRECKAKLFENSAVSVMNIDDGAFEFMKARAAGKVITYSILGNGDFTASDIEKLRINGIPGIAFSLGRSRIEVRIPGEFSVSNALCAAAVASTLGASEETVREGIYDCAPKGRFESVPVLPDISFIIDYAHNRLSLEGALTALKEYSPKRLICLFGSVGGRTQMRRAELGEAAGELCDFVIISSDNPDREPPEAIIEDIAKGVRKTGCEYIAIPDRAEAVKYAVKNARPGDIILFAGKGHENYQLINGEKLPFSEREIIEKTAEEMALKL